MSSVTKQSIQGTIYSYLGALIGFLTTFFVLTNNLSPEEIGLVSVLREGAMILCSFALLGLNSSAYRFFPYFKQDGLGAKKPTDNGFLSYMYVVGAIGIGIVFLGYYSFQSSIDQWLFKQEKGLQEYSTLFIPITLALTAWTILEIYLGQWLKVAFPRFVREVLLRLLFLALCFAYGAHWISFEMFLIGFALTYFLCFFVLFSYQNIVYPTQRPRSLSHIDPSIKRSFVTYTLFYLAGSLGTKLASRMDLFMVSSIDDSGFTSGGIYTIAFYVAAVIEMPLRSILPSTTPKIAQAMKDGNTPLVNKLYKQVALYQLLSGGLIFVLLWCNISDLYTIIPQGDLYRQGLYVVLFLGLTKLLDAIFTPGNTIISCSKYYRWNLYYTLIVTFMGIYLNYLLISRIGLTGAAIGTLVTQLSCYALQQIAISYKLKMSPLSREILWVIMILIVMALIGKWLPSLGSVWLNIFYKSILLLGAGFLSLYLTKASPELNDYIARIIKKIL